MGTKINIFEMAAILVQGKCMKTLKGELLMSVNLTQSRRPRWWIRQ